MLEMNLLSQFILLIKNLALATTIVSATSFYFGRLQSASVHSRDMCAAVCCMGSYT